MTQLGPDAPFFAATHGAIMGPQSLALGKPHEAARYSGWRWINRYRCKFELSGARNRAGLQTSAERLAQSITVMSDGHLKITVYPADTLVRAFEVFDAVATGVADMYH